MTARFPRFDASNHCIIATEGQSTVVAPSGKVGSYGGLALGGYLDAAIDRTPESVILDLSLLEVMGATGMVAICNAEQRLADLGLQLVVRSNSVVISDLLTKPATAQAPVTENVRPGHGDLGPEGLSNLTDSPLHGAAGLTSSDPRVLTALPADSRVVDDALQLAVELTLSRMNSADGVSVSLMRHGALSTVAATDQTVMDMDADQYANREGPCVDASLNGHWFHAESLLHEGRWPSFTPRALELGIRAILSSPLKVDETPIGALNIYSRRPGAFATDDQRDAALFARKVSVILADAHAGIRDSLTALRYQEALRSREVITLATGVLMEREGIDEDDAFTALLRLSLQNDESLRARAKTTALSSTQHELGTASGSDG